ncbi:hypothetical protein H4582DRAFT_2056081 [Lactarius indigo]|nr:hypothetical protein H4582DRAFT_2056081 [Lactarius indigo]
MSAPLLHKYEVALKALLRMHPELDEVVSIATDTADWVQEFLSSLDTVFETGAFTSVDVFFKMFAVSSFISLMRTGSSIHLVLLKDKRSSYTNWLPCMPCLLLLLPPPIPPFLHSSVHCP